MCYSHFKGVISPLQLFGALLVGSLFCTSPLLAATLTVTHSGSGSAGCTLRNAILAANTNATVGTCTAGSTSGFDLIELTLDIQLTAALPPITSAIQINGNGFTIGRCGASSRFGLFRVNSDGELVLNGDLGNGQYGLTLQCGETTSGAAIYNANGGRTTARFVRFIDNLASVRGGAIYNEGDPTDAGLSAGVTARDVLFSGNRALGDGGAVYNLGRMILEGASFSGGCRLGDPECQWDAQKEMGNASESGGGAIYNAGGEITLTRSVVAHNSASIGGGIANSGDAQMIVTNTLITGNGNRNSPPNDNAISGGGIHNTARMVLRNVILAGNRAAFGGAIDNNGANRGGFAMFNSTVVNNCALSRGGAIRNQLNGRLEVYNSVIWNNDDGSVDSPTVSLLNQGALDRRSSLIQRFDDQGNQNIDGIGPAQQPNYPEFIMPVPQPVCARPQTFVATDFYPLPSSPLVDRGHNDSALQADISVDFLNRPRIQNAIVDLGAFETQVRPLIRGLSTRGIVGSGENSLIGGIILSGAGSKLISFVARGPSLIGQVQGTVVADPQLEVFRLEANGSRRIASNRYWTQDLRASELANRGLSPFDAGTLLTLSEGAYTVVVSGLNGSAGVGLVEIYDEQPTERRPRLVAISTRGFVGSQLNEELIGGVILTGPGRSSALWMGKGPSLAAVGVQGALQDPTLTWYSGEQQVFNNDWRDWTLPFPSIPQYILRFHGELAPRESAILRTDGVNQGMSAGAYTAVVRDAMGIGGIAIVEMYEMPELP